jgi:hypothetical protein
VGKIERTMNEFPAHLMRLLKFLVYLSRVVLLWVGITMIATGIGNTVQPAQILGFIFRRLDIPPDVLISTLVVSGLVVCFLVIGSWRMRLRVWMTVLITALNAPLFFLAWEALFAVAERLIPIVGFISYWVLAVSNLLFCLISFIASLFVWYALRAGESDAA